MRINRGITFVEIMVVIFITAIVIVAVWNLFFSGKATFNAGIWRANAMQEIAIGFRQVQEDFRSTGYFTMVTPDDNFETNPALTAAFDVHYNPKLLSSEGVGPGDKVVEFAYAKQALKKGFPKESRDNCPGIIHTVKMWIDEKRTLKYVKREIEVTDMEGGAVASYSPSYDEGKIFKEADLIHDVEYIRFIPKDGATLEKEKMFSIEIGLKPRKPDGTPYRESEPLVKSVSVKVHTELRGDL